MALSRPGETPGTTGKPTNAAATVRTLVGRADLEVIPLRNAEEKLQAVPLATTIAVTCSAKPGLDRTLVGATAHYVTVHLDEGPIIEQTVARADHAMTPEAVTAFGRDAQCRALARSAQWHSENRVLLEGRRTGRLSLSFGNERNDGRCAKATPSQPGGAARRQACGGPANAC